MEVSSFTSTDLTISNATLTAFAEGALVMPLRLGKLRGDVQGTNWNAAARQLVLTMHVLNNAQFDEVLSPSPIFDGGTYRNLPVWDISTDYLITPGTYQEVEGKDIRVFGDNLGKLATMTTRDYPRNQISGFSMEAFGRDEFWRLRAFLHYLRGRQKAIWVPTGREDFTIESTTPASGTEINVEEVNYTDLISGAPDGARTRQDIEILYTDGTKDRRRITSASATAGVREVLVVDSGLSQECSAANVQRISYLVKRRLISDAIEFSHQFYEGDVIVPGLGLVDVYDGD